MKLSQDQRQLLLAISLRMSSAVIAEKASNEKKRIKKQALSKAA